MSSFVAKNYSGRKVPLGGTVRVYGYGFSSLIKAWLNETEAVINDYDDDFIEVSANSDPGDYTLFLGESNLDKVAVADVIIVDNVSDLFIYTYPEHPKNQITNMLLGLLPRGFAWYKGHDGFFYKLMFGLSYVVAEIYRLIALFRLNSSPSHTDSLDEWELELRLPESGVEATGTEEQIKKKRLSEIYRKACKRGGNTIPYFKSIAALFGANMAIYEYWKNPEKFEGVDFGEDDPNFYWMLEIEAEEDDWHVCTCNDTCNDYLQWWWNAPVESMFELIKPAHTRLLFAYVFTVPNAVLTENLEPVLTEDGRVIVLEES